jgi:hypothetical protein
MSLRRMMLFTLGSKIKNLVSAFRALVLANQGAMEADTCMETQLTELDNQGLLDSADIVFTPNGYADGEVFQLKPTLGTTPIRNLLYNTGLFSTAFIANNAVSYATSTASTDPFGGPYSNLVAETAENTGHNITARPFPYIKFQAQYTFSVYLKKGNGATAPNIMQLYLVGGVPTSAFANFNINIGTVVRTGGGLVSASIQNAGNGWWRCIITFNTTGAIETSSATVAFTNNTDATSRGITYVGATTSNVFMYGLQFEESSTVSAYQDIAVPQLINNAGGVIRLGQLATKLESDKNVNFAGYNLIRGSSTPEGPLFVVSRATSQANVAQAPDGTMTAYKIVEDTSNGIHFISATVFFSQKLGSVVSASVYLKAAERTRAYVEINDSPRFPAALFDLLNGTLISTTSPLLTASIESVGDGWYKCNVSLTRANVNNIDVLTRAGVSLAIMPMVGTSPTYTGNGTSGILVWQPQAVLGTTPKPLLPSTLNFFPKLSYNDFDGYNQLNTCPILNLEMGATNLFPFSEDFNRGGNIVQQSQDFTQAVWLKGGSTIVSSTRVAPDGTSTATELSDVGASSTPGVTRQGDIIATSTSIVYSIYTKNVSTTTRRFLLRNTTTATNFDILTFNYSSTGDLGNGWFSEDVGNGWFRLSYIRTTGINIGNNLWVYYGRTDTAPVGATDVWQVWGAQVEPNERLTDYTLTTTTLALGATTVNATVTSRTTPSPNRDFLADTLTANANNATLIKIGAGLAVNANRVFSIYLKRKTGTGNVTVSLGQDSVIANINATDWTRVSVQAPSSVAGIVSTYSSTGTAYTVTTTNPHGLLTGESIRFDATSGGAADQNIGAITVTSPTQFTFVGASVTTSGNCQIFANSGKIQLANSGDEVFIWGANLEGLNSSTQIANSYTPSYTLSTSTRATDVAYFNIPSGSTKTVFFEYKKIGANVNATTQPILWMTDNIGPTFGNDYIGLNGINSMTFTKRVNQVATTFANPLSSYGFVTNKYQKIAFVFNSNNVDIWIDGAYQTTTSFATANRVRYMVFSGAVGSLSLKSYYCWNAVLNNSQLTQLTYNPYFTNGSTELTQVIGRAFANSIAVPPDATLQALDTFILALKASGTWDKMDAVYNFAYNNVNFATFSRLNLKNTLNSLGTNGTMTYQTNGYLAGAGSSYLTGYRPGVSNVQYQPDAFSRTHILYQAAAGARIDANTINDLNDTFYNSNTNAHRALSNTNLPQSVDMSGAGLKSIIRNTSASVSLYNQSTGVTLTQPRSGAYGTSQQFFPFGNGLGVGFSCFGAPLTQTDIDTIRTAYNTYLTAIGLTPFA